MADERTRYSDAELEEFKQLILKKLENARADYELLRATITHTADNDTEDTSPTFKVLEEGAATLSKEESGRLAAHQMKFIRNLEMALVRIENKTYGICKTTGKLIPKERLMKVPHVSVSPCPLTLGCRPYFRSKSRRISIERRASKSCGSLRPCSSTRSDTIWRCSLEMSLCLKTI